MLILLLAAPADAKNKGVGSSDLNLNSSGQAPPNCGVVSCHDEGPIGAALSMSVNPAGPYTAKHKINITINATSYNNSIPDTILGIMLVNNTQSYPFNIKYDGWSITRDEVNNGIPVNYNEKSNLSTVNQTYLWNVTVPSNPGTYYIESHARYSDRIKGQGIKGYGAITAPLTMVVMSGDEDLDLSGSTEKGSPANPGQCGTGCHTTSSPGAAISITANPSGPYNTSQQNIVITVSTSNINKADDMLGIVLLNNTLPLSGNIKKDGWQITRDANGNPAPYSYDERAVTSLNQTFSWNVTAPSTPGTYYIRAQARYGGGTGYAITSNPLTMAVQLPVPEFSAGAAIPLFVSAIAFMLMRKRLC
ncbi:MAG TPA: hypothetical protein HA257_00755 [Candidatus Methanoperedenaceae archaeon]|nr:hypothetical protein [Candidatus Methanoperedenaceae archaeon]